jgi:hypothetical protein
MGRGNKRLNLDHWEAVAGSRNHGRSRIDPNYIVIAATIQQTKHPTVTAAEIQNTAIESNPLTKTVEVNGMLKWFGRPDPVPIIDLSIEILHHIYAV